MKGGVAAHAESGVHRTPEAVLEAVRRVGPIALDPFAEPENGLGARQHFTRELNAFTQDWLAASSGGLVYAFPPPTNKLARAVRFVVWQAERGCELLLLVPARTDTSYASILLGSRASLCFWSTPVDCLGGRSTRREQLDLFCDPEPLHGWDSPPGTFPALFAYWGRRRARFERAFAPHGSILRARTRSSR